MHGPTHGPSDLTVKKQAAAYLPKKFFLAGVALAGAFLAATFRTGAAFLTGAFDLGAPGGTWMPVTGPLKNMDTSDERTADRATPDAGALKAELRNNKSTVSTKGWAAARETAQASVTRLARVTRDACSWRGGWLT